MKTVIAAALALCCSIASAQPLTTEQLFSGSGYLFAHCAPGDNQRLFVVNQSGSVRIYDLAARQLLTGNFVTTPGSFGSETGLLGMAFHPQYQQNGFFYVYYSTTGQRTIARYHVDPQTPNVADQASATIILRVTTEGVGLHQGGWLAFGPDGYLYVAWGNEGIPSNSQIITNKLLGKILRLDVNGPDGVPGTADDDAFPADANRNCCIPPTNPFVGITGDDEIWCYGLRNPFRCSWDRETGDLWIGDVGDQWEEIDMAPAGQGCGRNYGYPCMDGSACGASPIGCTCHAPGLTLPVHTYQTPGGGQAVIGGYVYRGCALPEYRGRYLFGDYVRSKYWSLGWNGSAVTDVVEMTSQIHVSQPRSFGEDNNGELYICANGGVYRIVPAAPDCNGNGVTDGCEILSGAAPDVNHNFIIDSCEHPWPCHADYNQDGDTGTDADIEDFFACLGGTCCPACGNADFNGDGDVGTDADIESFFSVLGGGPC